MHVKAKVTFTDDSGLGVGEVADPVLMVSDEWEWVRRVAGRLVNAGDYKRWRVAQADAVYLQG